MNEAGFEQMVAEDREAEIYAAMKQQREPLVCAVMLVNGRETMVRRAVASFRAQTYERKALLLWDSGECHCPDRAENEWHAHDSPKSIGALRNRSIAGTDCLMHPEIIAHWDSDDLSHPNRLAEQVALLQSSGAECVGYHQAVFWDERREHDWCYVYAAQETYECSRCGREKQYWKGEGCGEAWIYTGQVPRLCAIGASLCYWRKTWERVPFDDLRDVRDLTRMVPGEDSNFVAKVQTATTSAIHGEWKNCEVRGTMPGATARAAIDIDPRIICAIHGGNTVEDALKPGAKEWRRASELDAYCREAMRLP